MTTPTAYSLTPYQTLLPKIFKHTDVARENGVPIIYNNCNVILHYSDITGNVIRYCDLYAVHA